MAKQQWRSLFEAFIKHLRINSRDIQSLDARGAPLDLWTSQKIVLDHIERGMSEGAHWFMIGKSRQVGCSTIIEALVLFWLAIHNNMIGAYVSDRQENRKVIRQKIDHFINSFPPNFFGKRFKVEKANDDYILFSNGSRLDLLVAGVKKKENWGEGRGYALVHATECSKYGSATGLANFVQALSEVNPVRLFIFESTSNGMNHWKEMWDEFGRDEFNKRRIFVGWWGKDSQRIEQWDMRFRIYGYEPEPEEQKLIDKVYRDYGHKVSLEQLAWYREKQANLTVEEQALKQNQPWTAEQSFVLSGWSFFPQHRLIKDSETAKKCAYRGYKYLMGTDFFGVVCEEIYEDARKGEITLKVWEEPDENGIYVIGVDPAGGSSEYSDRHAISVFRCFGDKLLQVAEYADNDTETKTCAWVLAHLAGAYKNCVINVEAAPGPGGVVINELENLRLRIQLDPRFENVGKDKPAWDDFLFTARWYLYKKPDHFAPGFVKCWESTHRSKTIMMHTARDKYACDHILIQSTGLIEEMLSVVKDGDRIEAPSPSKDDRVIAMALAIYVWSQDLQMSLLSQGETYERYLSGEDAIDPKMRLVQEIVGNFFKSAEEEADIPKFSPQQKWMYDKGL